MRYGSVCSGIEAASVAWDSLGWTPQWFSEIEPFPSAVLAHHYPNVPNFGDMTKFKEWKLDDTTTIDVLVGGTPCQSFSVAGLRKGLEDPRGNLMLTYLAIANKYRPKWLVWENVPGVLSSNGGNDFASFLRGLGELGYGFAYRILDAQYFGVAQRRRRVFVVGCLGDWRGAAAVLFERHSLSGHPAPSREARQEIAGTIGARTGRSIGAQDAACGHMISGTLYKGAPGKDAGGTGLIPWPPEIAPTLDAHFGDKQGLENQHINGGGGYIPSVAKCLITKTRLDMETETMIVLMDQGGGIMNVLDDGTVGTLRRETHGHEPVIIQPIALAENTIGRQPLNGGNGDGFTVGGPMYTLNATGVHGVATNHPVLSFKSGQSEMAGGIFLTEEFTPTLQAQNNGSTATPAVFTNMAVRRLTPTECERLQGFPDNYTNIPWRKKEESPDGPRYKALGNSMAVPVMHWIGKRIADAP
jgi:DNA (cytosine-5)-methyltransferase 1